MRFPSVILHRAVACICVFPWLSAWPSLVQAAETPAANEQVQKVIETFGGRGTLADATPPTDSATALRGFTMRPDVAIDLIAAEPAVEQPLYLSWDSQGRIWVVQYRQYQFPAGLKITSYDQHLRAKFDRVPQPPPRGEPGADKISVFTDADRDGIYEQHRDVITGLNIATSALVGAGGIWVLNPPYLLFYPDANRDAVPDGDPEVALSGFGIEDTHAVANSLQWGPDGWLYGANGSTTTGAIHSAVTKNVRFEGQLIWRYHPGSRVFEIVAEGGGNTFSLDFDSKGRLFSGTNSGNTRGMHYEQGSYGSKNWGKHGPLTNPYAFGWFEHMAHEGDKRRFPQAFTVYEGGLLGSAYEGKVIAPNSLANLVYVSELIPQGSTFRTRDEVHLCETQDRWFRPVDIHCGPDGALYMADWYDTRLSHVRPVDDWHKTSGRIYRIRPSAAYRPEALPDLAVAAPEALLELLGHTNEWVRKQAALEMGWRKLDTLQPALRELALDPNNPRAFDALSALDMIGGFDEATALSLVAHPDAYVRRWAIRLVGDKGATWKQAHERIATLAGTEAHVEVLTQLAASAKRLPAAGALPIIRALASRAESTSDPRLPLMLWWALERQCTTDPRAVVALFSDPQTWALPAVRAQLASAFTRRFALAGTAADLDVCAALMAAAPDDAARGLVVKGLATAFDGGEIPVLPKALAEALNAELAKNTDGNLALAVRTGDAGAKKEALRIVGDTKAPAEKRAALARALAELHDPEVLPRIRAIFKEQGREGLKQAVLAALVLFDDAQIARDLLESYEGRLAGTPKLREAVFRALASRPAWTSTLLSEVDAWRVPAKHVPLDAARQMLLHDVPAIRESVTRLWPAVTASATPKGPEIERVRAVLRAGLGDPAKGKMTFQGRCAACHMLFGEGGVVGPDLTGYERGNMDFWLHGIIDPSIEIREGYGVYSVQTKAGQIYTGMLDAQDGSGIVLRDAAAQKTALRQADIASMEASKISLMPEGMLAGIGDDELRDFFAYLSSTPPTAK